MDWIYDRGNQFQKSILCSDTSSVKPKLHIYNHHINSQNHINENP